MATQHIPTFIRDQLSLSKFSKEYFFAQKPVIIKGLFDDQPLGRISEPQQAKTIFADIDLEIVDDYKAKIISEESFNEQAEYWSFSRCIDHIISDKQAKLCSRNYQPLEKVEAIFKTPEYCRVRPNCDMTQNLFLANDGNITHLHFDNDHRSILMYQIFGKKRVILVPPSQSRKVCPMLNESWINIENFTEEEKSDFVSFIGGYDCVLQPGDALFIPILMWHYVEYIGLSMSLNYRFGRSDQNSFLSRYVHGDLYLQNIAARFNDHDTTVYDKYFQQIKAELKKMPGSSRSKYQSMRRLFKDIYIELCGNALQRDYYVMENDQLIDNNPAILRRASHKYDLENWADQFGLANMVKKELAKHGMKTQPKVSN